MKKVYIAGKLSNSSKDSAVGYIQNVSTMMQCAEDVRQKGFSVFVPSHDLLMGIKFGDYDYPDYFENNIEWLKVADYIFVCPNSEDSIGTQKEIDIALSLNIPVFYELMSLLTRRETDKDERPQENRENMQTPSTEMA